MSEDPRTKKILNLLFQVQLNILTKFIYTAKMCLDLRNYATAISIIDALENYIVRQLPVWKMLPSKSVSIMEDLVQVKVRNIFSIVIKKLFHQNIFNPNK
jgi:hypothetical protein